MAKFREFLKSVLIWFFVFYGILLVVEYFWGPSEEPVNQDQSVVLEPVKKSVVIGNLVSFQLENTLDQAITLASVCESPDALRVERIANGQAFAISDELFAECGKRVAAGFTLEPGAMRTFALKDFNQDLFSEEGSYQLQLTVTVGEETQIITSAPVKLESPGVFRQLFRAIVSKPLFNVLTFFAKVLPGHSFGWAIVLLTLVVRVCLFLPNQKAMRSQRELQKLQPKIEEIRNKHKNNQQMIAMKTMELYKTHKINPMSSCLPLLLQMPFLLGIYYIVQDGLSPHLSYLLYSFNEGVDLSVVDSLFYGLNLEARGTILLALIVAGAQWGAIRLSLVRAKKKKAKQNSDKPAVKPEGMAGQMQQMNTMMQWVMPVMIGFFTTSFPAGVGIYWLTSTVFGIGQQWYVNWLLDKPQVRRKES